MEHDFQDDIDAINRIQAVPTILDVVCRSTGMGFAAVARVTEDRWIACSVLDNIEFGIESGGELVVETTICNEIRQGGEAVVINHVAEDEVYCGHPTPAMYGFQSYISMPIMRKDGSFFGTLCAIDPRPARLTNPETIGMFRLFAELIASHLDAIERVASSEASLLNERKISEFREQFIAVLGHDLRNPLASISAGANLLSRANLDEKSASVVRLVKGSVVRMNGLIDNTLDFARGRLGGGIALSRTADEPLEPVLNQVIDELRLIWPNRKIETRFAPIASFNCDRARIGQLFSNLLTNALKYGAEGEPVQVEATTREGDFELSVVNSGEPIPPEAMDRLFLPFYRGRAVPDLQGLGLGLYIASEIARAHGGKLTARSSPQETRLTFHMAL